MRLFFLIFCLMNLLFTPLYSEVNFTSPAIIEQREKEGKRIFALCQQYAKFYRLKEGEKFRDITHDLLKSSYTPIKFKRCIEEQKRRIIVFSYPSDGYQVKGYISLTANAYQAPLLLFLRGGNRLFGVMNPANSFSLIDNYTVLGTTYRGGVSEGEDQYGGNEVNDVENLVKFIPQLETLLKIKLRPKKKYILGASRGGLEMFLALQRSFFLQSYFDKAVSLSSPTDLNITIDDRENMKRLFVLHFGLKPGENEKEWIRHRNPIDHCTSLKTGLPILMIQGTQDNRVRLTHGHKMYHKLASQGNNVTYWEIEGGEHCLKNIPDCIEKIADWLNQPSHSL